MDKATTDHAARMSSCKAPPEEAAKMSRAEPASRGLGQTPMITQQHSFPDFANCDPFAHQIHFTGGPRFNIPELVLNRVAPLEEDWGDEKC